uniref:hypothetical protein n=1 Tax=Limnohabitans sp. TaxID=1907725 RepID=UPI0040474599
MEDTLKMSKGAWRCRQGHEHRTRRNKSECNKAFWRTLAPGQQAGWRRMVNEGRQGPVDEDEPQSVEEEGEEVVVDDRMELVLAL